MLFSLYGEISLSVIGLLYVLNKWFSTFVDMMELMKNEDDEQNEKKMTETARRMYS